VPQPVAVVPSIFQGESGSLVSSGPRGEEAVISTTVMLVEDNRLMLELLTYVVQQEPGLQLVATASDGDEAVALGVSVRPHVVVMDVRLPGRDGVEATRELCRCLPDVRVVVLSAICTRRLVHLALAAGACGYLVKDGSHSTLVDAIRSAAVGGSPFTPLAHRFLAR
jgi:DNA-binding NarL/FixJ family response regulator